MLIKHNGLIFNSRPLIQKFLTEIGAIGLQGRKKARFMDPNKVNEAKY